MKIQHLVSGLELALLCGCASLSCLADEPVSDPASHTVIVPYDGKKPLDVHSAQRFYLDYAEFQRLWNLAKENRKPAGDMTADAGAPAEAVVNSAIYDVTLESAGLTLKARFNVLSRGAKWARLRLPLGADAGSASTEFTLDGRPALRTEDDALLIEKPGAHVVEAVMRLKIGDGWKQTELKLPPSPAAPLAIRVPDGQGRPALGAGAGIVSEELRDGARVYTVSLSQHDHLKIMPQPFRKRVEGMPPAIAETKATLLVLPGLERVNTETVFRFNGTERTSVSMEIDPTLQVESVTCPVPGLTSLRSEGGRRFVDITFLSPVVDEVSVSIRAERVFENTGGERVAPSVSGVAARATQTVGLGFDEGLQLRPLPGDGVERAPVEMNFPAGALKAGSYRFATGKKLAYAVVRTDDRTAAHVDSLYQLSAQKAEIISAITLDSGRGTLADARIAVPAGFEVQTLAGPRVQSWHRDGGDVFVRFDSAPQREAKLVIHVAKTSAQPVKEWTLEPLGLPQFAKQDGSVMVAVHAADEVKLTLAGVDRSLVETDPSALNSPLTVAPPLEVKRAMKFTKGAWSAKVALTRQAPRFVADAVLLAKATDDGLLVSQRIGIEVEQGALDHVKISLPVELGEGTVTGMLVRDVQSKVNGKAREYDVTFQTDVLDRADLSIGFDLPLDGVKTLPVVKVAGALRTRAFIITDNASVREMKATVERATSTTKESVPLLPDGLQRPQYFRAEADSAVKLSLSQLEVAAGNSVIITLAEITTALRNNGERWESAEFTLANRTRQFLPVKLPEGAELIEVSIGGQAVRADRAEASALATYLVPLIQMRAGELSQKVRLVYRIAAREDGLEGKHRFDQPELPGLSVERTVWNVWVPPKFAANDFDGNMDEIGGEGRRLQKLQSDLSEIARLNRVLASGNLSDDEAKLAFDNASWKLGEVQKQAAGKKAYSREGGRDRQTEEKLERAVSQIDAQVQKGLQEQTAVFSANAGSISKMKGDKTVNGLTLNGNSQTAALANNSLSVEQKFKGKSGDGTLNFQGTVANGLSAAQTWNYNGDAPVLGKAPAKPSQNPALNAGQFDVNDNVSVQAGTFFAGTAGGARGVTKSGAGTFVVSEGKSQVPQVPAAQAPATTLAINGSLTVSNTSNARAGANANFNPAVTAQSTGDSTLSLATPQTATTFGGTIATGGVTVNGSGVSGTASGPQSGTISGNMVGSGKNAAEGTLTLAGASSSNTTAAATDTPAATTPGMRFSTAPIQPDSIDGLIANPQVAMKPVPQIPATAGAVVQPPAPAAKAKVPADRFDTVRKATPVEESDSDGFAGPNQPGSRLTPQLKPVGRVSLAVDVPLDGTVYSFSKVKDHATLEVTVKPASESWRKGGMIVLGVGLALSLLVEFLLNRVARRRKATL